MFLFKILIWLSIYFALYILFSSNTLISIFCFILIIILSCVLLLNLHIEYLTFLILLLYLGGILIFFLFTALMLNNEYVSVKNKIFYSFENVFLLIIFCKSFFYISILNNKICFNKIFNLKHYLVSNFGNNFYQKDLLSSHSDVLHLVALYCEKGTLLIILGMILLFTMVGVIVITKNKHV